MFIHNVYTLTCFIWKHYIILYFPSHLTVQRRIFIRTIQILVSFRHPLCTYTYTFSKSVCESVCVLSGQSLDGKGGLSHLPGLEPPTSKNLSRLLNLALYRPPVPINHHTSPIFRLHVTTACFTEFCGDTHALISTCTMNPKHAHIYVHLQTHTHALTYIHTHNNYVYSHTISHCYVSFLQNTFHLHT